MVVRVSRKLLRHVWSYSIWEMRWRFVCWNKHIQNYLLGAFPTADKNIKTNRVTPCSPANVSKMNCSSNLSSKTSYKTWLGIIFAKKSCTITENPHAKAQKTQNRKMHHKSNEKVQKSKFALRTSDLFGDSFQSICSAGSAPKNKDYEIVRKH